MVKLQSSILYCIYRALKWAPCRNLSSIAVFHSILTGPQMDEYGQLKISVCPSLIFGRFLYNVFVLSVIYLEHFSVD
jgi:hypothetical protein